jgi:hypothetical protein
MFAISSVVWPPEALVPERRNVFGSNGGASSPLLLGFYTDVLYIGAKHC